MFSGEDLGGFCSEWRVEKVAALQQGHTYKAHVTVAKSGELHMSPTS